MNLIKNTNISIEELTNIFEGYSCADIESMIDKIKTKALLRALKNSELNIKKEEPIMREDVLDIINTYRNSISSSDLEMFKLFEEGGL